MPRSVSRAISAEDGTVLALTDIEGVEPTVVFLHGLAGSSRELLAMARSLAPRRVVLLDQRGHGNSSQTPADLSRSAFVNDAISVIDSLATGPIDLVGHSMGGHTAMLTAAARPDLVRRLVLLEVDAKGTPAGSHGELHQWLSGWRLPFADRADAVRQLGGTPLAHSLADDLEARSDGLYPRFDTTVMLEAHRHLSEDRWAEWRSVSAPTLVMYGEHGMFDESSRTAFASQGQHVTRIDVPGASHDLHLDSLEAVVSAVKEFLSRD